MMRVLLSAVLFALVGFGSLAATAGAQDIDCQELTYEEAQDILAQDANDPHFLDGNRNGIACENKAPGGGDSGTSNDTGAAADNSDDAGSGDGGGTTALPETGTGPVSQSSTTVGMLLIGSLLCAVVATQVRLRARS